MKTTTTSLLLAFFAGAVHAQDEAATDGGPFGPGWYVAPMISYVAVDSGRCGVDNGWGPAAIIGHRGDFASLEFSAHYQTMSYDCDYTVPAPTETDPDARAPVNEQGDLKLTGGGLGLLVGPFFEDGFLSRIFGVVGFGVNLRDNHPQYEKDVTTIYGDAGVGYMQPFTMFDWRMNLRSEVRYRYDVQQPPHPDDQEPPPAGEYGDVIFSLGVQIPFAQPEEIAEESPAPVAVVPAAFTDSDGDGVIDELDECPGTPEGSYVDNKGCAGAPEAAAPAEPTIETAKAGDRIVLKGVNFETGSATLTVNARNLLDAVAAQLNKRPELRIEIGGHTDSRGSDSYNQGLSERRAASVRAYLVEQGVDASRLTSVGYGEDEPIDTNETSDGRERNRRVELKVIE